MKKTKEVEIDGKKITVSEMTAKDITLVLQDIAADGQAVMDGEKALATIDLLFGVEVSSVALCRCTGLKAEELENMAPSDIRILIDEVKALNPFFFEMLGKLVRIQSDLPQPKSKT